MIQNNHYGQFYIFCYNATINKQLVYPSLKIGIYMKVNEKIRMVRETKNWSQEDMAEKLAMSTNGYAKIERGETGLNLPKLERIAKIFDMDLIELLSVSDKSVICLISENSTHSSNYYGAPQEIEAEIEKMKLLLSHKDVLLMQQAREIEVLQLLVETLKTTQN